MEKANRIQRLRKAREQYRRCLRDCVGDKYATAKEQRGAVLGILTSISSQLEQLGAA